VLKGRGFVVDEVREECYFGRYTEVPDVHVEKNCCTSRVTVESSVFSMSVVDVAKPFLAGKD